MYVELRTYVFGPNHCLRLLPLSELRMRQRGDLDPGMQKLLSSLSCSEWRGPVFRRRHYEYYVEDTLRHSIPSYTRNLDS